jgi:hypothetical protein
MQDSTLDQLRAAFLSAMPPDGSAVGNIALRNELAWDEEKYTVIRNSLIEAGVLAVGSGRGGSVRRADRDQDAVESQKRRLLDELPLDRSGVANRALRERLGWYEEQYEFIKAALLGSGLVRPSRGGGVGGSICRTETTVSEDDQVAAPEPAVRQRELSIYGDFLVGLHAWAERQGWTQHEVEQIASQGRRATGGTWTRPDFVVIGYKTYDYSFGRTRDVETFEVKMADTAIDAVFETAAHSRFATKSYLVVQRSGGLPTAADLSRIESECQRFSLGLILFTMPNDSTEWEFRVSASRREPDPGYLEEFIRQQLNQSSQHKLRQWMHP